MRGAPDEEQTLPASGLKVGRPAPTFVALHVDGRPFSFDEIPGRTVLLTFWSDRVSVSRHFATLRQIRREFANDKRLQIVSVYREGEFGDWLQFLDKQSPLDERFPLHPFYSDSQWWQVCLDPSLENPQNPFKVGEHPHSFLIGADGKIVATDLLDKDLREAVVAALKKR